MPYQAYFDTCFFPFTLLARAVNGRQKLGEGLHQRGGSYDSSRDKGG
nr:MAG TPA: hypothetical protein [Caudoviricetes sp.]